MIEDAQQQGNHSFLSDLRRLNQSALKLKELILGLLDPVNEILSEPSVRAKLAELGVQPVGGTRAETNSFITRERQRWGELIRAAGIQAN